MREKLHTRRVGITAAIASGALAMAAAGVGAYRWKAYENATPRCSQVMFAIPKGGPGAVTIDVFPVIEGELKPIHNVHGAVTGGLNAGHDIMPNTANTHGVIENYTWQTNNPSLQWSRILVSGEVDGRTFQCREQTMTFIPDKPIAGPQVPTYPPF